MSMWIAIAVMTAVYYWSKVEREKIKSGGDKKYPKSSKSLEKKVAYLLEENEELKEELEQIKYALGLDPKDSISIDLNRPPKKKNKKTSLDGLTPYEREQLRLDQKNKFKY